MPYAKRSSRSVTAAGSSERLSREDPVEAERAGKSGRPQGSGVEIPEAEGAHSGRVDQARSGLQLHELVGSEIQDTLDDDPMTAEDETGRFLFEDLRCPHDRNAGGFADPQDLFLQFGEAVPATFHGKVATGDHHATGRISERSLQDGR